MNAQTEELPSQRLAKVKLGELSLLKQITQQGVDLKKLRNEMRLSREENQVIRDENRQLREDLKDLKTRLLDAFATRLDKISEDSNTRFDKAAKDSKTAFAKAAKESRVGLDTASGTIISCLDDLLRPLQGFLSVSKRQQENQIIGFANRKKGGDAWVPLRDVNDNAMINDVTSMSVLDSKSSISTTISCSYMYRRKCPTTEATVTDLETYAERVG
jgi:regulator of replication initiation timing